jgi:hypothetical protein
MHFELTAKTEAGGRLVALAETLAEDFATRAGKHDREGSYPFESFEALRSARYFAAPFPSSTAASGSPRRTTYSSPRAGWPAGTPRLPSASTCT